MLWPKRFSSGKDPSSYYRILLLLRVGGRQVFFTITLETKSASGVRKWPSWPWEVDKVYGVRFPSGHGGDAANRRMARSRNACDVDHRR